MGARVWESWSVFALLVFCSSASSVPVDRVVGKCCPSGQVLSVQENFTCADSTDPDRQLHRLRNRSDYGVFRGCEDSTNLTITSLAEIVDDFIQAPSACIDVLWDEKISRTLPIVFQCRENPLGNDDSTNSSDSRASKIFRAPKLASLRLCCPANTFFDARKRDCVPAANHDHPDVFHSFGFLKDKFDFLSISRGPPECDNATVDYAVNRTSDVRLLEDGRIEVTLLPMGGESVAILVNDTNSCFDLGLDTDRMILRICAGPEYCNAHSCVRKCCSENEWMVGTNCRKLPIRVEPGNFHNVLMNVSAIMGHAADAQFLESIDYGLLTGNPCKWGMFPVQPDEGWHVTERGEFNLPLYRLYKYHEHCMEIVYENRSDTGLLYPFVCFDENSESAEETRIRYGIFGVLEVVSCIFLVITLCVYICLPALQNLHGKTLMCHVASLTVAYAILAVVGLSTPQDVADPSAGSRDYCKFLGFTLLLSWVAAFSWLNVMCFDIWWTFGGLGAAGRSGQRGRAYNKRFFVYSLYAWGFPLSITIISWAIDYTKIFPNYLSPNVGSDSCWFERNVYYYGEILFFLGPVSIQLIANVIFFVLTAKYCSKVKAEIARVMVTASDPRSRRFRADKTKLLMNVKLFIVMGVSWILEVVSACINHYATNLPWRNEFFYAADLFNCLQGLMIFILFVLKSKVYEALRRRLRGGITKIPSSGLRNGLALNDPHRVQKSTNNNSNSSSTNMSTFGAGITS